MSFQPIITAPALGPMAGGAAATKEWVGITIGSKANGEVVAGQVPMMRPQQAYVIAVEGDDIGVFRTIDAAERSIEPEDALADYTQFYAGDGSPRVAVPDASAPLEWRLRDATSGGSIAVRPLLLSYLEDIDVGPVVVTDLTDIELLDLVADIQEGGRSWMR